VTRPRSRGPCQRPGRLGDFEQRRINLGIVTPDLGGQADLRAIAIEQPHAQQVFQPPDLVADGGLGDAQVPGRVPEPAMPGRRVKRPQRRERRQISVGFGQVRPRKT